MQNDKKIKQRRAFVRIFSLVANIGVTTVVCILIGVFLGRFLDDLLGTSPLLLILLTLCGFGAAFKNIYDISMKMYSSNDKETKI